VAKTTIELPEDVHRTLRVKAALEQRSMNAIILEAIDDLLGDFHVELHASGRQTRIDGSPTATRRRKYA
jgi:plasmid stability protein